MPKLVWMTGISGCAGDEFLDNKFLPLCRERKKKVEIIYPGKMLFEIDGTRLDPDNVLYTARAAREILEEKMHNVFNIILGKLGQYFKEYETVIIKTHKWFRWEKSYIIAHAAKRVTQFEPDIMVTFVDGIGCILDRLNKRSQFHFQNYAKSEICDWQNIEVDSTRELADIIGKPFFVIPTAESPELLYSLLFQAGSDFEPAYVAVDITHSLSEVKDKVSLFVERAKKYLPFLINPYTIPLDYKNRDSSEENHIINMSLNWFVPQSKIVIGYYPYEITSHGKTHELHRAYGLSKNVWVVYLSKKSGPFEEHFKTRPIFRSEKEFFEFLKKRQKA